MDLHNHDNGMHLILQLHWENSLRIPAHGILFYDFLWEKNAKNHLLVSANLHDFLRMIKWIVKLNSRYITEKSDGINGKLLA